jgi:imidazolonepropionase-like amidohydrolase
LMDEPTAKLIAERGIWLSTQPFPPEIADTFPAGSQERQKALEVIAGTDRTYKLARKHNIKTAFGTDILFSQKLAQKQSALLASLARWYSPAEILRMATSTNADLLQLSGKRNPYEGELGVVKEGALADLLLVDGNPLEGIALLAEPDTNLVVVMKDGAIAKNKSN